MNGRRGNADRGRERVLSGGAEGLADGELLAVVLGTGHARTGSAAVLAASLIDRFGSLRAILNAGGEGLRAVAGIGDARAAALLAVGEIGRRCAAAPLARGAAITTSRAVFDHFGPLLIEERRERFYALALDTKNRVTNRVRVSEGSLAASLVHPREAFRTAVREAAAAVIFLHNHPSGDPTPSLEDKHLTERLRRAGELLGIPVLDHVVVGRDSYYSFADAGW